MLSAVQCRGTDMAGWPLMLNSEVKAEEFMASAA